MRDQRADNQGRMVNMFSMIVGRSRTLAPELSYKGHVSSLDEVSPDDFFPTLSDIQICKSALVKIVSRKITQHLTGLTHFSKIVPKHILHRYSREMACKSEVFALNAVMKNECVHKDMVDILKTYPMHNLLLGMAKHMLAVWKDHFESIQKKVDSFVTPSDVGRIPFRIASGFSGFTADQWHNWIQLYSLCSLKEFLPQRDYNCWLLFVKACALMCRRSMTSLVLIGLKACSVGSLGSRPYKRKNGDSLVDSWRLAR